MSRLLKGLQPRATRQSDSLAVSKAATAKSVPQKVKGGTSLYTKIANITELVNTKLYKYKDKYELLRTDDAVIEYFGAIIENGSAAIDTETSSLDPITCSLAGVCLYVPGKKPAYIPMHHVSHVTGEQLEGQVGDRVVKSCLEKCNEFGVKWVMHNAKFDIRVIKNQLSVTMPCFWDTMLAAKCMNENESAKLKDLHFKYCITEDTESLSYDKLFSGVSFTQVPINVGYLYSAGDGIKTWELMEFQKQYLNRRKLPGCSYVFRNIEMPLVPVIAEMEDTGVTLDMKLAKQLSDKYNKVLDERKATFYSVIEQHSDVIAQYRESNVKNKLSNPINIGSPTQIAILLYDILGLKSPVKSKPRGTGEEILSGIDSPICKAILDYRETSKLLSTYVDKLPTVVNQQSGRIHCNFNQYGAATGRFSSSNPNMQNIPSHNKEIRQMFTAAEGYVLISADFSQQEPRTLAHMSQDEHLKQAYFDNKDIYAWIAERIYNVPYEECLEFRPDGSLNPEGKKRRSSVKSIILGIMYGRGNKAIAEQIGCSAKEAQKIVDSFYNAYPNVKSWMEKVISDAHRTGYVETAWGRKRRLPNMLLEPYEFSTINANSGDIPADVRTNYTKRLESAWGRDAKYAIIKEARSAGILIKNNGGFIAEAERQCVNSIIQGTSADMTKLAMIDIGNDEFLNERKCKLLIQVHDEVIAECPQEYAQECSDRLSYLMVEAARKKISVPMKCDAEITRVWYGESVIL